MWTKFDRFNCEVVEAGIRLTPRDCADIEPSGEKVEIGFGLLTCDISGYYKAVDEVKGVVDRIYVYKRISGKLPEFLLARPDGPKWGDILVGHNMIISWDLVLKKEKR